MTYYQVDAFTDKLFGGNYAGVCPLTEWLPEQTMQLLAMENNLPETAFFVGGEGLYDIRWFTPEGEIDLCGHATLASAFVLNRFLNDHSPAITFRSASGPLTVTEENGRFMMDFPSRPGKAVPEKQNIEQALGVPVEELFKSRDYMAVLATEEQVRNCKPDLSAMEALEVESLMITAPGTDCDFVSRFFAPGFGIPEDPATGSSHCTLIPYWAEKLGKTEMTARQLSSRGGEFYCRDEGDRVSIGGKAVLYLKGEFQLP